MTKDLVDTVKSSLTTGVKYKCFEVLGSRGCFDQGVIGRTAVNLKRVQISADSEDVRKNFGIMAHKATCDHFGCISL